MAKELLPDVVLMDINMPGIDGIRASREITQALPSIQVVIMSVQSEADYLRQAMLAGARDFLMKPFGGEELSGAIRSVYKSRPIIQTPTFSTHNDIGLDNTQEEHRGKIISVFSPKGGSGCTTIAINLAVSLATQGYRTLLLDGCLQFGDVSVMLNLKPTTTILDLIDRISELDADLVDSVALTHDSGLKVLLAPPRPEMAELVTSQHITDLLGMLKNFYDFIVVDTNSYLSEKELIILDNSERIILNTLQSLPSLKSTNHFYDLADGLEYESYKILLVVNRSSTKMSVSVKDIGDILRRPVVATIPVDEPAAMTAADRGYPLVVGPSQKHPIALALTKLTNFVLKDIMPETELAPTSEESGKTSYLGRLFGR